ncbi:MAG: alpha-galactosidase [Armatimonadota bacterium]
MIRLLLPIALLMLAVGPSAFAADRKPAVAKPGTRQSTSANDSMGIELRKSEAAGGPVEFHFASDQTRYVEALTGGVWKGRYWSSDGFVQFFNRWDADAFEISILKDPKQEKPTRVEGNWQLVSSGEVPDVGKGKRHYVVELANAAEPVKIKIHTVLDGTPIITRWMQICNTSNNPIALKDCSPWSGKPWTSGNQYTVGYIKDAKYADESKFMWDILNPGVTVLKGDKGQGWDDPFFIVLNDITGEYLVAHLAWSANYETRFNVSDAGLSFWAGPTAENPQRVISPGEWITTPALHLGFIKKGFDAAVQAMHDHIRLVMPKVNPDQANRIQYLISADHPLNPYGYAKFTLDNLKKCIDVAHAIGVETFIMDYGWWKIPGDWYGDPARFPNDVGELADYAHSKGMGFAAYVESEGGRGDIEKCSTYIAHPDWFWGKVVNMTVPEAAAWVESEDSRMIHDYKLDIFRLDYNPGYTMEGPSTLRDGFMENNYWRYYEATYGMYERLVTKYPKTVFQQAAFGGARMDLGMAGRFHENFVSDLAILPNVFQMISGETVLLPPETQVFANGAQAEEQDMDTRLRVIFCLTTPQLFYTYTDCDLDLLSPQIQKRFLHYADIYKKFIRPALPTCKVYHHAPVSAIGGIESGPWFAMEYTDRKATKGWTVIAKMKKTDDDVYRFIPRGLDIEKRYRVIFDSLGKTIKMSGYTLATEGLPIRLERLHQSELVLFEAM